MQSIDPIFAIAALRARYKSVQGGDWRNSICSFAEKVSDGEFISFRWLKFLEGVIQPAIERGGARIILNVPPRHGKSWFCSKYLPAWFLDRNPTSRTILVSYEATFAAEWGMAVRDLVSTRTDILPNLRHDVSARKLWATTHGGSMVSTGAGGIITGRGGNLILVDDPIKNWKEAYSKTHQLTLDNWFDSTLMTRIEPNGSVIIIMQRWGVDDLTAYLKKKSPGRWTVIALPALAEADDPLGREIGEALCPERFTAETLIDMRENDIGTHKFNAMYQQRPAPIEGGFIKRDWWRFYDRLPEDFDDSIGSWDLTFKKTERGSFVCGGAIARKDADYLILPKLFHERCNFPDQKRAIVKQAERYPWLNGTLIEDAANGPAVMSELEKVLDDILPWKPQGKIEQASSVSPTIESGHVYLPNPAFFPEAKHWVDDFIEEWSDFPDSKNDDFVDFASQGIITLKERNDTAEIWIGRV